MMIARWAREGVLFKFFAVNNRCALRTLRPESVGHLTELLLGGDVLILSEEPSHMQKYATGRAYLPIARTSY